LTIIFVLKAQGVYGAEEWRLGKDEKEGDGKKDNLGADNDHGSSDLLDVAEAEEPCSGGNEGCRQDKGGNKDDYQRQTATEKRRDKHRRGV
jgi:hypothetical protein